MKEKTNPAPLYAWLAAGVLLVGAILGFALLVRADLQRVRVVDVSEYVQETSDAMISSFVLQEGDGYWTIDGYIFLPGERIEWMENAAALYDGESYYRIGTAMIRRDEATAAGGDGTNYSASGLTAFVRTEDLPGDPSDYELCILYGTNHHKILVHTGRMLEENV